MIKVDFMADPISGSHPVDETSSVDTTKETPQAKIGIPKPKFTVGSMEELKKLDPEAYKEFMKGIAEGMIEKSRKDTEKFKKAIKGQE